MPEIIAKNVNLHYPLTDSANYSGAARPKNLIDVGQKRYIWALQNISFSVSKGQRVGIVGRNGSGKSTLLRVLGKIYMPTSGSVETVGAISSMFNLALGSQADATGRENILIRGLIKGMSRREIKLRMPEIIEFSELGDFIDFPIRTYSDGMRMRLLFAIATSFSPEVLLLDEWIGAGDAKFQKKAAERMNGLVDQAGITIIASHNRNLLREVCDLGLWLDGGIMRAFGQIDEVYREMDSH